MDTIFMNSENSRTFEYHALILKLADKLNLKGGEKSIALSNLSICYTWKKQNADTTTINLKYQLHEMINLNYLMDHT